MKDNISDCIPLSFIYRRRPSQPALNGNGNGNGGGDNSLDYEKLKQEILTEMRKELQKTKTEIIDGERKKIEFLE